MKRSTSLNGFCCVPMVCGLVLWLLGHETAGQNLVPRMRAAAAVPIDSVALPAGVIAEWDLAKASRETTPTRERICLNGLWRWQPAHPPNSQLPTSGWGYFKVPGSWPGITDYMQKDSQTVHAHPDWRNVSLGSISAAWYERDFTAPVGWAGRRITVSFEYLNSYAEVYLDGDLVGEVRFPGGEIDLSSAVRPAVNQRLSLLVVALPLQGVMQSYTDTAAAREVRGSVARRGLCGDVFLVSTPAGPRVADVRVATSVRRQELTLDAALEGLIRGHSYELRARVREHGQIVKECASPSFTSEQLEAGRFVWTISWMPPEFWDLHTPQITHALEVTLHGAASDALDEFWNVRFGFREFWIEGRDFFLNGSRIHLSMVPLDNAQVGAALANYPAARESLERLKSFGINYVYTHNYGCEPGSHLGFTEILRAADDVGMLVGFSQPHFSHYDWRAADADGENGYARHAAFYVRAAQNHPSVVMYAMSHNATGYHEDMNPEMIDGIQAPRDAWATRNVALAQRAEAIVRRLDPSRIVYHHASGNLGPLHAINFYPNFVPIQELSDWFGSWADRGVKPVFLCEYGAPFTWDWTMYRGWYRGEREFGSAKVPWEFCLAEWNAQFLGDRAFPISEPERENLRWEAAQFRAGRLWHRWDYPHQVGSTRFDERYPVFEAYLTDNWRAFRTWGVSAISPWEHGHFWKLRDGVDRSRRAWSVDWEQLQRPGFSPDYVDRQYERVDLAFDRSDWIITPAAAALHRNNRPLLAYLGGKPAAFTSKDHNVLPGESIEKQLIVINDSRETVTCDVRWSLELPRPITGAHQIAVDTGEQARIPLRLVLPVTLVPGRFQLRAVFDFSTGERQEDSLFLEVLPSPGAFEWDTKTALFDPRGETAALLQELGVRAQAVDAGADLSSYDLLIVGKAALEATTPAPDIRRVRDGLKVILFEQTSETLERRFGFRVQEYGLRQVFRRQPDHPILAGISESHLRDWRGEATILAPRLTYELRPRHGPTVSWCDLTVTRLWRAGNRGNVSSVMIEKPVRGDFQPILDGGYSLQYSPLLEYREGRGVVLFCQLDVTARTEPDPAADTLVRNLLRYLATWQPSPRRAMRYAGDPGGREHLSALGLDPAPVTGGELPANTVLVLGPGAGREWIGHAAAVRRWLEAGGHLLALGLDQDEVRDFLGLQVSIVAQEHISTSFEPFGCNSFFAGIGPADLHNRDPRPLPLVTAGAEVIGNGVLARAHNRNVIFCQLVPWQFEGTGQMNLKRTHRRVSFLVSRLLANLGVAGSTPLLSRFSQPPDSAEPAPRWAEGFYLDQPEEWDDPYRFFRW
jgi:beta-galactosidase